MKDMTPDYLSPCRFMYFCLGEEIVSLSFLYLGVSKIESSGCYCCEYCVSEPAT